MSHCQTCSKHPCCCPNLNFCCLFCPSLCQILTLLVVWSLFDIFCCQFACDCVCNMFSAILLSMLAMLIAAYLYCGFQRFVQFLKDVSAFKSDVDGRIDAIECKLCSMMQPCNCLKVEHNCRSKTTNFYPDN